ncbi:MAG TPA: hypothetical protein VF403_13535 [Kofleriaceae bacterium]
MLTRAGIFGVGFLISGCWFDANYKSGQVTCDDGYCPSNLFCVDSVCVSGAPSDARFVDAPGDSPDAPAVAALTCTDPGTVIAADTVTGTTAGRTNTVSALCNGIVMNGPDAVYKLAGMLGQMLTLTPHSSAYPITAYAIAPCTTSGVPSCTGSVYATDTTPMTISIPATTDYFIIVDGGNAALSGAYSLTIALH